jgi:hypothetical protein
LTLVRIRSVTELNDGEGGHRELLWGLDRAAE